MFDPDGHSDGGDTMSDFEQYRVHLPCPVHLNHTWYDGFPFEHNIRVRPDEKTYSKPSQDRAFIYSITHVGTGMRYVGETAMSLSARWEGHRSARKSEKQKNDPLYRAMNEDGLQMFVMEVLEECEAAVRKRCELDYMRQLDSWNREKGYNGPHEEAKYARLLCFLFDPTLEVRYNALWQARHSVVAGFGKPLPPGYDWLEKEQRELEETLQREGRRLMETIPSFMSPVLASLPPPDFFRNW
jgi:hypothetical protein